jgi:protease-4
LTPEGREALAHVIGDLQDQFVGRVAAARHMAPEAVRPLADGRVFTGRQALEAGLVDAIGGEREARDWLAQAKQVPADLPVHELELRGMASRLLGASLAGLTKSLISEWLGVDPVLALWQPPG